MGKCVSVTSKRLARLFVPFTVKFYDVCKTVRTTKLGVGFDKRCT